MEDIRDRPYIEAADVRALNFVRQRAGYLFRRHYRTGLRSHIFEVLKPGEVQREKRGVLLGNEISFPRAQPVKVFRIFRSRFGNLREALDEVQRVRLVSSYLSPDHVAGSDEFLVTYIRKGLTDTLLCGLQEYVNGEILDPWGPLDDQILAELLSRWRPTERLNEGEPIATKVMKAKDQVQSFVEKAKKMMVEAGHIPDLAGIGNLLITHDGLLKLVDINNISPVSLSAAIYRDDRGYPVCDKSIEALSLLEGKVLGHPVPGKNAIYEHFLEPKRMQIVRGLAQTFGSGPWKGH